MTRRYALLVGIDHYLKDGTRRFEDGNPVSLENLNGCVNDVRAIQDVLEKQYNFYGISVFTSVSTGPDLHHLNDEANNEQNSQLPTHYNIKQAFSAISHDARAGDFFFFHFSGHGARLKRVFCSPLGREKDPSLITADFCCGQPAIRGWELNCWLRALNDKGVQVVVSLDSCHSGGAWRGDAMAYRSPEWATVANLPSDELAASQNEPITGGVVSRDIELEKSWSINPTSFTLMTACASHEKAAERSENGQIGGAYTNTLLGYLRRMRYYVTYRMIGDYLRNEVLSQKAMVFGRDGLLFFESREPFPTCPLSVRLSNESHVHIPVGKAHGVYEGTQFTTFPSDSELNITVHHVEEFSATAKVTNNEKRILQERGNSVIATRWCLGENRNLRIFLATASDSGLRTLLLQSLEDRIIGNIEVIQAPVNFDIHSRFSPDLEFVVKDSGQGFTVAVLGHESLAEYNDFLRHFQWGDEYGKSQPERLVAEITTLLLHLTRFGQILRLMPEENDVDAAFEVTITPNSEETACYNSGQRFKYIFKNNMDNELHFAVLDLTAAFSVQQIFPSSDSHFTVAAGKTKSFAFRTEKPVTPSYVRQTDAVSPLFTDVIRTMVLTNPWISWKALELPKLWDADQRIGLPKATDNRDARLLDSENWWIHERKITTTKAT